MGIATLLIAGAGVQAYGQYQQGKAAEAQGKVEQQILEQNAQLKEREAQAERERAQAESIRFGKEGEALQATQRVGFAKGGVLASQDTPALLLEQTAMELEADRLSILEEGYLRGGFRESEARGLRFQGSAAKARGKNIKTASTFQAAGSLLTGFGTAGFAKTQLKTA